MRRYIPCLTLCLLLPPIGLAGEAKATKIHVIFRGAVTDECAQSLRASLKKVPGVKFKEDELQVGEKGPFRHYFSPLVSLELANLETTDIGAVAKVAAQTKTAKRDEIAPSLNLILYHPALQITEPDVSALREALAEVAGVESRVPGGTGAVLLQGYFWVRLDGSGNAKLADVRDALKRANLNYTLEKP